MEYEVITFNKKTGQVLVSNVNIPHAKLVSVLGKLMKKATAWVRITVRPIVNS